MRLKLQRKPPPRHGGGRRGSALVIVLAVLILVVALLVAFLSNATRETIASDTHRRGVRASDLARTAAELVTAQLRDGTTRGPDYLWATQPGLLRSYGADGAPDTIFKLYSDDHLSTPAAGFQPESDLPGESWRDSPDIYTDINEPVAGNFPVLDPYALGRVAGFTIGSPGGETTTTSDPADAVAMPVSWLYVLADGTVVAPTTRAGETPEIPGASTDNPIVGRIAFWTDDDSTKVNPNTAGGAPWNDADRDGITDSVDAPGTYHATPHTSAAWDIRHLDGRQPFANEFQRTPGHPATTHLSAVFPDLEADALFEILPRLELGGTLGGTRDNHSSGRPNTVALDRDRLYTHPHELAFTPARTRNTALDPRDLAAASFFLTTDATSPDTTPFGTPKVSMWPLHADDLSSRRSVFDRAIAFCHEFGDRDAPHTYYFERRDPLTPREDFLTIPRNQRLYRYLSDMGSTAIPGFGRSLQDKFGLHDLRQLITGTYDYIRTTNLRDRGDGSLAPFAPDGLVYPTLVTLDGIRTAGLGRFETVSEFGYLIHQAAEPRVGNVRVHGGETKKLIERDIRAAVLWETVCLAQGFVGYRQNHIVEIKGLDKLRVDASPDQDFYINRRLASEYPSGAESGVSLGLPEVAEIVLNAPAAAAPESHPWGGTISPATNMLYSNATGPGDTAQVRSFGSGGESGYPFVSGRTVSIGVEADTGIDPRAVRLEVSMRSPVTFNIYANDGKRTPLGTYRFAFPVVAELPMPVIRKGASPRSDQFRLETRLGRSVPSTPGTPPRADAPWHDLIHITDIVRTVQPAATATIGKAHVAAGDLRHLAVLSLTEPDGLSPAAFRPREDYIATDPEQFHFDAKDAQTRYRCLHSFATNGGLYYPMENRDAAFGSLVDGLKDGYFHNSADDLHYWQHNGRLPDADLTTRRPNFSDNIDGAITASDLPGDWDSGTGYTTDGPFTNKQNGGTLLASSPSQGYYFGSPREDFDLAGQFAPNRIVPSPAVLGSLPSGVHRGRPWETLCFTPGPASGPHHFSKVADPPDHLFLEFFHMPVVAPYAISTPAATAGRINLNTQIAPFTHIQRDTGLYAALAGHRVTAIPAGDADSYKTATDLASATNARYHRPVDIARTVEGIRRRFEAGDIYRTPSEICEVFLVPTTAGGGQMFDTYDETELLNFWSDPRKTGLTGDNLREAPYARLYPKLTTRSNTFTVHVRAQVVTKVRSSEPGKFDPERDLIEGEWRGSFTLQRQLDPTDDRIPDYALTSIANLGDPATTPTLDQLHHIRVAGVRRFIPNPEGDFQ